MSKIETLNGVVNYLDSIPCINEGGCSIAAYSMFLWLKKNNQLNSETCIVYAYEPDDEIDIDQYNTNRRFINQELTSGTSCSHAFLYHNGKFYDSDGEWMSPEDSYIWGNEDLSLNSLCLFVPQDITDYFIEKTTFNFDWRNYWNPTFDRSYIYEIEEKLNIKLRPAA